jgi:5-methylcytosine-specific restriction endonuclease McrA
VRRIPLDQDALRAEVLRRHPKWFATAAKKTDANRAAGKHAHGKSGDIWSQIKHIFQQMQLQTCAYCEKRLGEGGVGWEVEHFRPKREVVPWTEGGFADVGGASSIGYYLLVYDLSNYVAACGRCNNRKANYFPTDRSRLLQESSSVTLRNEQPYLINPLDVLDANPDDIIQFFGPIPRAVPGKGRDGERAEVTIAVLGLAGRDDLAFDRCAALYHTWNTFANSLNPILSDTARKKAGETLDVMCRTGYPQSSCIQSFRRLIERDASAAEKMAAFCTKYLDERTTGKVVMLTLATIEAAVAESARP